MTTSVQPPNEKAQQRLQSALITWFTTVRANGRPHSIPVWFLWHNGTILVFSKPGNQKLRNLQHNQNVVLSLDNTNDGEDVVVIEGTAKLIAQNQGLTSTLPEFAKKYADEFRQMGTTPESMAAEYSQAILVTPTRFLAW